MSISTSPENSSLIRRLNFLLRFTFFATGVGAVLIGQVLPILTKKLAVNDAQAGYFFTFQFTGSLGGTLLSNWFARRGNYFMATIAGCFLMGAGVLFLNLDSYWWCLFGFFLNGLGIGLTIPSINMLTLELNPTGSTAVLNVLNLFWGVGAISSQPFVDFFSRGESIFIPTLLLALMLFGVATALFLTPREIEQENSIEIDEDDDETPETPIWTNPIAWLIALFNFVHVGFEGGVGGWLKTYTERLESDAPNLFPPIFLYFLFFVVGRGIAPLFLRFLDENKLLLVNLTLMLAGTGILLYADDLLSLSLGASIAGLGTSSTFPTNLSRFTKTFGASATRRATPLFLCGTLGAVLTTWTIGFTSNYFGNLRAGMFVLLTGSILLVGLQTFLMVQKKRNEELSKTYS